MPKSKRFLAFGAVFFQGYAIWALLSRSLIWPVIWPTGWGLYVCAWLMYLFGYCALNVLLTSEFVRKTQLESDVIAARQIQQTLQPVSWPRLPGYEIETFYKPFREVGGDYFDVIELSRDRILFALADVSGKSMAAALLAANIQALVRSISTVTDDPVALATQINQHLSHFTPRERYATALFVVLCHNSGEITYVNAGHNAPILSSCGAIKYLNATGLPLGLFEGAEYAAGNAVLGAGGALLAFTDGLTDSIAGPNPEERLCAVLADGSRAKISEIEPLIDPKFNEDDVTVLLIKRANVSESNRI